MKKMIYLLATSLCAAAIAQEPSGEVSASGSMNKQNGSKQPMKSVFKQGDDMLPGGMCGAYNAPAGIALKDEKDWMPDGYFDLSFLYYYASQEGMNLATSGQLFQPTPGGSYLNIETANGTTLAQNFEYKPAFKVGLGANFYEWMLSGEYTWIRQTILTSKSAPAPVPIVTGIGTWVSNNWFEQFTSVGATLAGSAVSSNWHLAMDLADLTAGRPFYEGKNLTVSPFFGLRAAWIRQKLNVDLAVSSLVSTLSQATAVSQTSSNCWGVGPRAGFGTSCLLGMGFRLEADAALSALYTVYTRVNHTEQVAATSLVVGIDQGPRNHFLRPELEMGLGFGWGMYLDGQKYHIDFAAGYDFNVFWDQNMMRTLMDETVAGVGASPGNLYLHGLNLSGRFDF